MKKTNQTWSVTSVAPIAFPQCPVNTAISSVYLQVSWPLCSKDNCQTVSSDLLLSTVDIPTSTTEATSKTPLISGSVILSYKSSSTRTNTPSLERRDQSLSCTVSFPQNEAPRCWGTCVKWIVRPTATVTRLCTTPRSTWWTEDTRRSTHSTNSCVYHSSTKPWSTKNTHRNSSVAEQSPSVEV